MTTQNEVIELAYKYGFRENFRSGQAGFKFTEGGLLNLVNDPEFRAAIIAEEVGKMGEALTADSIRASGGIVHKDGNIFFTNIAQMNSALLAAKEQGRRGALESAKQAMQPMLRDMISRGQAVDIIDSLIAQKQMNVPEQETKEG